MKEITRLQLREELKKEVGVLMPAFDIVDIETVKFNDRKHVGFSVVRKGEHGGPTIWVDDDHMRAIESGMTVREMAQQITAACLNLPRFYDPAKTAAASGDPLEGFTDDVLKKSARPRLADIERNTEFLKDKPHRDLGLGYTLFAAIEMERTSDGYTAFALNDNVVQALGCDAEPILDAALEHITPHFAPIETCIMRSMSDAPISIPNALETPSLYNEDYPTWILSNPEGEFGAAAFFVPGVKEKLFDLIGGSFYVLPSSIHEVIIIPAASCSEDADLPNLVCSANRNPDVVRAEDFLSDNVLFYDGKTLSAVSSRKEA